MTNKRETARATVRDLKARDAAPAGTRVVDETPATGHEWTMGEVASQLSLHRVTLLRMEERGFIPKARWRRKGKSGNPNRVYNAAEIQAIKDKIEADKAEKEKGRHYVEDATVAA